MTLGRGVLQGAAEVGPPDPQLRRPRGSGSVYYHLASRSWAAQRPRSVDPKRAISYHPTEAEAHAALDAALDASRADRTADPLAEPFGAFLKRWLAAQRARRLAARTLALYAGYLKFVTVEIGRVPIGELKAHHVNTIVLAMEARGLSTGYIADVRRTLRKALDDGYAWADVVARNPVDGAIALEVARPERQCWSEAEARRFLEAVRGDPTEVAWRLALDVGLRAGELRGLVRADYDRVARTVRVDEQSDDRGERRGPKGKRSRTLRLTRATCQALDRHLAEQDRLMAEAEGRAAWAVPKYVRRMRAGPDAPLLPALRKDGAISGRGLRQQFVRLRDRAGVKAITIHDLRHTAASIMLRRRLPLPLVSKILGHRSPVITAQVYAHVIEEMEAEGQDAMEAVFAPDPDG